MFTAIVLSPASQNVCIEKALALGALPHGHPAKCHHVTLSMGRVSGYAIGAHREMTVTHIGETKGRVTAFRVNGAGDSKNRIPHVTIAVFGDAKPKESNEIREWRAIEPFDISGKIEICD